MPSNALFVPPPVPEMLEALDLFERFMNGAAEELPVLLQCALLHLQFETIHPFLDGNGRLGRLLMTMLLIERRVLTKPLLYLSLCLKQNKARYYELLQAVRMTGDWEEWILFFVEGVTVTAERAVVLAKQILALFDLDEQRVRALGRRSGSSLQVLQVLQSSPFASPREIADKTGRSLNTVLTGLQLLQDLRIVDEITGRERGKMFCYTEYLRLLDEGTELA